MKNFLYVALLGFFIYSCSTTRDGALYGEPGAGPYDTTETDMPDTLRVENDTVRISNDSLEYEIIIIEPGFAYFLNSIARPEGYYSQSYLESKNRFLVADYNQRVQQPFRYDPDIYMQQINYNPQIDYGYEVNYKLYYWFVYLSRQYNQRFSVPTRI